ncbi:MAG TPA: VCBS repeat-containing protein, partial [Polyangiaceae bacterium]|nr:VCBS repeat-containing protein [Polyangiaceae bacterium]
NGILWEAKTQGARSGLAVFDFDGDGRTELVYADQCFMRVYDGLSGEVLFSTPRSSTTQFEYPVVADTDGDGFSEIVTTSNDNDTSVSCPDFDPQNKNAQVAFKPTHGVTVWKEAQDRWAGSRPIWNQHNYYVTNVRDDGTIPPMGQVETHWTAGGPNTFRQNVQGTTGKSLSLVDVTTAGVPTFDCKPAQNLATITVDLCNRGAVMLREDETEVAMVNMAEPAKILCQQRNDRDVDVGECIEVSCDIPVAPRSAPFNLMIMGDPLLQVDECLEDNNRSMISGIVCQPDVPR